MDYTLYLDESTTHSGSFKDNAFCMAGIIVKDSDYQVIENELNELKRCIWADTANPEGIVLHQMQVFNAIKSKQNPSIIVDPNYVRFRQNQNCRDLYSKLGSIFDKGLMTVVGASIDIKSMNKYYKCGNNPDPYLITLQMILENYCHFLCNNSGIGKILYESREPIPDQMLLDRYYHIKLMGSMYYTKESMNKKLLSMLFLKKDENNSGLQIADFVPNCFARKQKGFSPHRFNIDSKLRIYRYGGGAFMGDKFGVKSMP